MDNPYMDYKYNFDNITYLLAIETAKLLSTKQDELSKIKWSNGESNIDTEYSLLACTCCSKSWDELIKIHTMYENITVICSIPDINITFRCPQNKEIIKKIELKTSKTTKMHGSTIKKLDINQPLIYCLRPIDNIGKYNIRYSQYHRAFGETDTDLFQDRTPRPFINFKKMNDITHIEQFEYKEKNDWIVHYAKCAIRRTQHCHQHGRQHGFHKSWQDDMIKLIQTETINDFIENTSAEQFEELKLAFLLKNINI